MKEITQTADLVQLQAAVTMAIQMAFKLLPPGEAVPFIGAAVANAVGPMKLDILETELTEAKKPCGEPGCNCEEIRAEFAASLISYRRDWRLAMIGVGGGN